MKHSVILTFLMIYLTDMKKVKKNRIYIKFSFI
jgi:hypothetical protein